MYPPIEISPKPAPAAIEKKGRRAAANSRFYLTALNGHIMDVASNNEPFGGMFTVTATKLKNKERRIAFLHASANILETDTFNLVMSIFRIPLHYNLYKFLLLGF